MPQGHRGHFSVEIKLNGNSSITTVSEEQALQINKQISASGIVCVSAAGLLRAEISERVADAIPSNWKRSWPYF